MLLSVFRSNVLTPTTLGYITVTANLTQFAGKTIRLRFAGVNNQSTLIAGVDNVRIATVYTDTQLPVLNGIKLRNPGFGQTATFAGNSSDPTIIGKVADDGSVNNIASIQVDPLNNGFGNADDYQVTDIDALVNFVTTFPSFFPDRTQLLPGPHTIAFRSIDRAGNVSATERMTFVFQDQAQPRFSRSAWDPSVIPARASLHDRLGQVRCHRSFGSSGNTMYASAANGGV